MATKLDFKLPDASKFKAKYSDPENYILSDEQVSAIKVAMSLGQPLLITGEPGTGKTQLATKLAHDRQLSNDQGEYKPIIFNTKTTSTAQDLFYTYDAVSHFQDANIKGKGKIETADYIEFQALGKAIILSKDEYIQDARLGKGIEGAARRCVVLIDEIDKAPSDFPNDILYEIEHMTFSIKELGGIRLSAAQDLRPIVIMTSNSEKNLPEAFLRRCVFLHIPFPTDKLKDIVGKHLEEKSPYVNQSLIDHFIEIRGQVKKKKPSTAELIGWLRMLEIEKFLDEDLNMKNLSDKQKKLLRYSYSVLAKDKEDLKILVDRYKLGD